MRKNVLSVILNILRAYNNIPKASKSGHGKVETILEKKKKNEKKTK